MTYAAVAFGGFMAGAVLMAALIDYLGVFRRAHHWDRLMKLERNFARNKNKGWMILAEELIREENRTMH